MNTLRARPAPAPQLSVLIPALNEALALPKLLADLAAQQGLRLEILVADGGSSDLTPAIVRRHGAALLRAPRGRAAQLNAAVAAARAPWLLCLHADSRLTSTTQLAAALRQMRAARRLQPLMAGHWPLRFVRTATGHAALFRQLEAKSASNRPGTVNGDQGLMIHRDTLAALGGFDASLPFFEDQRLAAQVFARGRFELLPGVIETSARRFEVEGHGARLLLMALIVGAETAGLHDWLRELPSLYREQSAAAALQPVPFIESLLAHIAALPTASRRRVWQQAGRLVAGNAWQLALLLDGLHPQAPRWLPRFDARLAPLFTSPLAIQLISRALPPALRTLAAGLRVAQPIP
ncbi:MAG: glycosyltransferase [Pseudomonadota bacterium]